MWVFIALQDKTLTTEKYAVANEKLDSDELEASFHLLALYTVLNIEMKYFLYEWCSKKPTKRFHFHSHYNWLCVEEENWVVNL